MAASSSGRVLPVMCGVCRRTVQVAPPESGGEFTFSCTHCGTSNQASVPKIQAVQCYSCGTTTNVQVPSEGGDFTFACPHCATRNKAQSARTMSVQCGSCTTTVQVQVPQDRGDFTFPCPKCASTNRVMERSVVFIMCRQCRRDVRVQPPQSGTDFTFPCPHCRATNRVKDHPQDLLVTVPSGAQAGDTTRVLTPEGLKLEASVPKGYEPGSQFKTSYQPRRLAKESAQRQLSVQPVSAADLEKAPEDCRECIICMEEYKAGDVQAFLPCFHRFHEACAKGCLAETTRCPICKQDFHEIARDGDKLLTADA